MQQCILPGFRKAFVAPPVPGLQDEFQKVPAEMNEETQQQIALFKVQIERRCLGSPKPSENTVLLARRGDVTPIFLGRLEQEKVHLPMAREAGEQFEIERRQRGNAEDRHALWNLRQ